MILKKITLIIFIIAILFTFMSCNYKKNNNAEIQLWYYDYGYQTLYYEDTMNLITNIKLFCDKNKIPLKVNKYSKNTLSYNDYVLKRNLAAMNGNMIIIEDLKYMWDLSEHHADYSKLENYDNLIDSYKGRFCIPIGIDQGTGMIERSILDYYSIELSKSIITYNEYLEIKNQMKDKGAKFYLNRLEFNEIIDYYRTKHDLMYVNVTNEIFNNLDKLKIALKSSIIGICDDYIKYNESKLDLNELYNPKYTNVYDVNSELKVYFRPGIWIPLSNYKLYIQDNELIYNGISLVYSSKSSISPCFFMHEKITNDRTWDVANFIVSESSYKTISGWHHKYLPTFKSKKVRDILELDEEFNYNGPYKIAAEQGEEKSIKISKHINEISEMVIKNKETTDLIADYCFNNNDYSNNNYIFIANIVEELSKINFDYKNEEASKMLDTEIDKFINNFNILYK